jgi:polyisoprenoid-binding protein YceI
MKSIALLLAAASIIYSCSEAPKGDKASITEKQQSSAPTGTTYVIDTSSSSIRFTGHGVGKNHPGIFKIAYGTVAVTNNVITGGKFTIDIRSMILEQKGEMFDKKLRPHLMSGDFLDADKFDKASFEITTVNPYENDGKDTSIVEGANFMVSGNLTIKDVTKNVSFPAHIDLDNNTLKAKADFDIDRTQWQINFGNDKTLGDKFISETVNIELNLEARKADL